MIELTKDLIRAQGEEQKKSYIASAGSSGHDGNNYYEKQKASDTPTKYWKVGDKCQAKWTDGQ